MLLNYHIGRFVLDSFVQASAFNTDTTQTQPHQISTTQMNREQNDRCGNSTAQSQVPDDGYINVRNMLST